MNQRTVVIGVGNPVRGDDAIGLHVVRALRRRVDASVDVRELGGEPARLLEAWRDRGRAIVIDAVRSHADPGTVHRIDALTDEPPTAALQSTHGSGLAEAISLSRALDTLPDELIVVGVEAHDVELGEGLSADVRAALPIAIETVAAELER